MYYTCNTNVRGLNNCKNCLKMELQELKLFENNYEQLVFVDMKNVTHVTVTCVTHTRVLRDSCYISHLYPFLLLLLQTSYGEKKFASTNVSYT